MLKSLLKLLRNIGKFFKVYKQFGFVLLSFITAGITRLFGATDAAHIILAVSASINLIPLLWGMFQDFRVGTYGIDILAAMAIISSILFGEYWAGMVIVLMLTGGEALEDHADHRARAELTALLDRAPAIAHILKGRKEIDVKASTVLVGDKLIIKAGETVPVDAVVLEGSSDFDESSLTGESLPVQKTVGQNIMSGSVNSAGVVTVKALATAADSQYSQIVALVQGAQQSRAPFVRMADLFAVPFTLLSLTIALGAWAISGESIRFLQVLVVATPCPLILAAPIAIISGMSRATKHGIIIKNGAALEQLAAVRTMAFDKTGTLTRGLPVVQKVTSYNGFSQTDVLHFAASVEQGSSHILASAILTAAKEDNVRLSKAKHIQEVAGLGLQSTIDSKRVLVGRLSLLKQEGVPVPASLGVKKIQSTAAYVAVSGKLAGIILFEDELRPEAKSTLDRLKKLGLKHMMMITGDNKATASSIAKQLGLTDITADALPSDKLLALESIQHRPVGFVGDGVNDAPVLTASDVGVALGARGSTAASESADIVIMHNDLGRVVTAMAIAKHTLSIARQAILIGIFLSIILMFIFATGKFPPIYGALVQELVDIVVIVYALRAHTGGGRKLAKA